MKTIRQRLDELLEKQKWAGIHLDRDCIKGFDRINARRTWHRLDKQIDEVCRKHGMRRTI